MPQQPLEVGQRAVARMDFPVVGHIVTGIEHRRLEDGVQPDGIDTEIPQIA